MSVFDFFNEIWCINLDYRTDRWEHVQKEFEHLNIKNRVQRFSAIKHEDGRIGLIKSLLELFIHARDNKLENILIFEDDVKFINEPLNVLQKSIHQLKNLNVKWGMFYLGANTHQKLIKITPNLCILKNGYTTHAVCYHARVFDEIINKFSKTDKIVDITDIADVYLSVLQNKYTSLLVNPLLATQISSFSDIEKRVVNYSFIESRFKKNIQ